VNPDDYVAVLILAFDTSGLAGSVALLDGSRLLAERMLEPGRRSAQTLAPVIVELLSAQQIEPRQIRLVATTVGPGSFTGLRVGVTSAKTFAYAVGAEVIGLSTLETIANQVPLELLSVGQSEVLAVLDAQRQELFLGRFRSEGSAAANDPLPRLTRLEPDRIVAADAWLASLHANAIVTGTGFARLQGRQLPENVAIVPQQFWEPQAATVGRLAWRQYTDGRRDDLWKIAPVYLRPSYAEEKVAKA
jgi:tRNA threonylcarbamoyladenosine biosynthesis protein TsaB